VKVKVKNALCALLAMALFVLMIVEFMLAMAGEDLRGFARRDFDTLDIVSASTSTDEICRPPAAEAACIGDSFDPRPVPRR
jgi:hypothetical protein